MSFKLNWCFDKLSRYLDDVFDAKNWPDPVKDEEDGYEVTYETVNHEYTTGIVISYMAGVTVDKLRVELNFNHLAISGSYNSYEYRDDITFPNTYTADADNTTAEIKDGVVTVRVRLNHKTLDDTAKEIPIKAV